MTIPIIPSQERANKPPPLPINPVTATMPEPGTREWHEWLPTTYRMEWSQMLAAAGCHLRGCLVERAWDTEHNCHIFLHNGKPLNYDEYRKLQPAPQSDHEAFFRLVWDLHAHEDGRKASTIPEPPRPDVLGAEEKKAVDKAYAERDAVVALACRMALTLGFDAYLAVDETQDEDWKNLVFIDLPTGQVSWHVHRRELKWFEGLPTRPNKWDGHDTQEKYRRVLADWPWVNKG